MGLVLFITSPFNWTKGLLTCWYLVCTSTTPSIWWAKWLKWGGLVLIIMKTWTRIKLQFFFFWIENKATYSLIFLKTNSGYIWFNDANCTSLIIIVVYAMLYTVVQTPAFSYNCKTRFQLCVSYIQYVTVTTFRTYIWSCAFGYNSLSKS